MTKGTYSMARSPASAHAYRAGAAEGAATNTSKGICSSVRFGRTRRMRSYFLAEERDEKVMPGSIEKDKDPGDISTYSLILLVISLALIIIPSLWFLLLLLLSLLCAFAV